METENKEINSAYQIIVLGIRIKKTKMKFVVTAEKIHVKREVFDRIRKLFKTRSIVHKILLFYCRSLVWFFYEIYLSKMNALYLMVLWLFQLAG